MARVQLSRLPNWKVLDTDQEIRGLRLVDSPGVTIGLIADLIVDTDAGEVDALVLDTGEEVSVDTIETGRGVVVLRQQHARPAPPPGTTLERVDGLRVPVHRPIEDADVHAFQESTFAVRARAAELDVGKQLSVVEEIHINKDVLERTETIQESVRRMRVAIEELPEQSWGPAHGSTTAL